MYLCLERPVLEYASVGWDSCSKADAVCLVRMELSVAGAILPTSQSPRSNDFILAKLGWSTLARRRRRAKFLYLWP